MQILLTSVLCKMKREWTNRIRFILDECIPPIIRDSRWFMWLFYVAAYGRLSVSNLMNFKSKAYTMNDEEYADFYSKLHGSVSRRRETDLNEPSILRILSSLPNDPMMSLLDVGAGNGYLLSRLSDDRKWDRLVGVDVAPVCKSDRNFEIYKGALPRLPFGDKEFDVVTCTHVLEHVIDLPEAVNELIRITRKSVHVVVPRQRYYFYTLDEHLNFFPIVDPLIRLFRPYRVQTSLESGDWVLTVTLQP